MTAVAVPALLAAEATHALQARRREVPRAPQAARPILRLPHDGGIVG
jgi:hypothetical protein